MCKLLSLSCLAVALAFATPQVSNAGVIDFNSHPDDFLTPIVEGEFTFNFLAAGWGVFGPASGACCNVNYNGTTALYADGNRDGNANVLMSVTGGGTFAVSSFDAATYWVDALGSLEVIGNLHGGGTVSAVYSITSAFATFFLPATFVDLDSLMFRDPVSGAFLTAPGFGVDNINTGPAAVVPEPATLSLLGLGIAGVLARRRRAA